MKSKAQVMLLSLDDISIKRGEIVLKVIDNSEIQKYIQLNQTQDINIGHYTVSKSIIIPLNIDNLNLLQKMSLGSIIWVYTNLDKNSISQNFASDYSNLILLDNVDSNRERVFCCLEGSSNKAYVWCQDLVYFNVSNQSEDIEVSRYLVRDYNSNIDGYRYVDRVIGSYSQLVFGDKSGSYPIFSWDLLDNFIVTMITRICHGPDSLTSRKFFNKERSW
jgi:hypothetical protein